jgi:hypothetical protein
VLVVATEREPREAVAPPHEGPAPGPRERWP